MVCFLWLMGLIWEQSPLLANTDDAYLVWVMQHVHKCSQAQKAPRSPQFLKFSLSGHLLDPWFNPLWLLLENNGIRNWKNKYHHANLLDAMKWRIELPSHIKLNCNMAVRYWISRLLFPVPASHELSFNIMCEPSQLEKAPRLGAKCKPVSPWKDRSSKMK